MGLFTKPIPDEDWLTSVRPLASLIASQILDIQAALESGGNDAREDIFSRVVAAFPSHLSMLKTVLSPTSPQARQARKELELALLDYVDAAKIGLGVIRDLNSKHADPSSFGGRTFIASMATRQKTAVYAFEKAQKRFNAAADFIL